MTNYYQDVRNSQTVVIKQFFTGDHLPTATIDPNRPFPRPTFPGTYGAFGASARGATWRNEGRSVDYIRSRQKEIFEQVPLDPDAEREVDNPTDHFFDDFDGTH